MYTLSSPTVLATDAAVHPAAVPVLRSLSAAFRISPDGAFALARAWHDRDEDAHTVPWMLIALMEAGAPNPPQMSETLRAVRNAFGMGEPVDADALAGARFGTSKQVAALVATEAAAWPDAAIAPIPGTGLVPASAAVAAASVAAHWARPKLGDDQVAALRAPFEQAEATTGLYETGPSLYGPRTEAVLDLVERLRTGQVDPAQLAQITWPAGVWAQAVHEAGWACLREDRLRAQMRAVLDVTLEFVLAHPSVDPARTRTCLTVLHALTVSRVVGDAMDEKSLGELSLAEFGL
jgi:hypothetical protein